MSTKHKLAAVTTQIESATQIPDERIAVRAYEKWMSRGCPIGDGQEDWFAARAEIEQELSVKPSGTNRAHHAA